MKATQVRVWPELVDYLPALVALTDRRRLASVTEDIELDFGAVRDVTSTGLAMFALQLSRLRDQGGAVAVRYQAAADVQTRLNALGLQQLLKAQPGQTRLFDEPSDVAPVSSALSTAYSLPVYQLTFVDGVDRRIAVRDFLSFLTREIGRLSTVSEFQTNGMIMLLHEIAKNTADHANADAVFGMDLFRLSDGSYRVTVAFGDLGMGIKQHIEEHLPAEQSSRLRHMSLYEAYRLALTPGYTSNRLTDINKGHGMSIIVDCANTLGMHLSVFDAWSRGILSSLPTLGTNSHAAIRRIFRTVGHDVPFVYYGDMSLPAR